MSGVGCRLFCCWCAQDLAANRFWEAMGFVPLAFRTGSRRKGPGGKARVHIFWQKRIREGDTTTPWWFPSETGGGAVREDRLVLPIPPGVRWDEVMPVVLPEDRGPGSGTRVPGEEKKRLPGPARTPEPEQSDFDQPLQLAEKRGGGCGGLMKDVGWISVDGSQQLVDSDGRRTCRRGGIPCTGIAGVRTPRYRGRFFYFCQGVVVKPAAVFRLLHRELDPVGGLRFAPLQPVEAPREKPQREKRVKAKNDPKLAAAARELRDRWMELVNAQPLIGCGKYLVSKPPPLPSFGVPGEGIKAMLPAA